MLAQCTGTVSYFVVQHATKHSATVHASAMYMYILRVKCHTINKYIYGINGKLHAAIL